MVEYRRKWQKFFLDCSAHRPISEDEKSKLIVQTLPDYVQDEIDLLREEGKVWHCEAILTFLHERFGFNEKTNARRAWENVQLHHNGKVDLEDFSPFFVEFVRQYKNVGDATLGEARRLFLTKLPGELRKWVLDEECARTKGSQVLLLSGVPNPTEEGIRASIMGVVGVQLRSFAIRKDGVCLLGVDTQEKARAILALDGRRLDGQMGCLSVKRMSVEIPLGEMKTLIEERLRQQKIHKSYGPEDNRPFRKEKGVNLARADSPEDKRREAPNSPRPKGGDGKGRVTFTGESKGWSNNASRSNSPAPGAKGGNKGGVSNSSGGKGNDFPGMCFRCAQPGHKASFCPNVDYYVPGPGDYQNFGWNEWQNPYGKGGNWQNSYGKGKGGDMKGKGKGGDGKGMNGNSGRGVVRGELRLPERPPRPKVMSHPGKETMCRGGRSAQGTPRPAGLRVPW